MTIFDNFSWKKARTNPFDTQKEGLTGFNQGSHGGKKEAHSKSKEGSFSQAANQTNAEKTKKRDQPNNGTFHL